LPPKATPAAINKLIPPSKGTEQGGGQQGGGPIGGPGGPPALDSKAKHTRNKDIAAKDRIVLNMSYTIILTNIKK